MAKIKPVRVNLSTKANEIIATMREEIPVALYHFRKPYGGRNKYMKFEDALLDNALKEEQSQMTDIAEYISRVGNRWMTYTMVDYYPQAKHANATHVSFIYYETYGSCGAFFPLFNPESVKHLKKREGQADGVLIFTSHFFQRMSERTGKAYRSRELIQEFISTKSTHACETDADGEVLVKFKGGYGFGVEKSQSPRVVEVRTYLTDGQLSPKQRRKVEKVDAYAELLSGGMYLKEVAISTAFHTLNTPQKAAAAGIKKMEALKKLGLDKPMKVMMGIHLIIVRVLEELLKVRLTMPQSALLCHIETECGINEVVRKHINFDFNTATEDDGGRLLGDIIPLLAKVAKKMKLKYVSQETITECVTTLWQTAYEQVEEYANEAK